MKYFTEETDKWFDGVKVDDKAKANILNFIKEKAPTRKNLEGLMKLLYDAELDGMYATAQDIINGEFSHEFRFRYHDSKRDFPGKVSATSSFFSIVKQAITYND